MVVKAFKYLLRIEDMRGLSLSKKENSPLGLFPLPVFILAILSLKGVISVLFNLHLNDFL